MDENERRVLVRRNKRGVVAFCLGGAVVGLVFIAIGVWGNAKAAGLLTVGGVAVVILFMAGLVQLLGLARRRPTRR